MRSARLVSPRRKSAAVLVAIVAPLLPLAAVPVPRAAAEVTSAVTLPAPAGGTATVDKTEGLVDEVVRVTWTGFRPSVNANGIFSPTDTVYPVAVRECRGADPTAASECYGSLLYSFPERPVETYCGAEFCPNGQVSFPDGVSNGRYGATAPDGTGQVDIELRTVVQSSTLGCSATVACSLVVVPNYGIPGSQSGIHPGYPACATVSDSSFPCGDSPTLANTIDASYAWDNRVVFPLSFAPAAEACDLGNADVRTLGSPKLARLLARWQPALCSAAAPLNVDYTSQGEVSARGSFLAGLTDVGLTGLPAPGSTTNAGDDFTYAPIATSAITVAFHVDDALTHLPIEEMRLNPRLLAKLITESYGWIGTAPVGAEYGNPSVQGNPRNMFFDPEFLDLNPGHAWPTDSGGFVATPLLLSDLSDMTSELTRYITEDPDARAFLDGEPDPSGMRVNPYYEAIAYPASMFELRDPYEPLVYAFQTLAGLNNVASHLVNDQYAGVSSIVNPITLQHEKLGIDGVQPLGTRAFVAIMDTGNAAAFRAPTAALRNGAGSFVAPTSTSMQSSVQAMSTNADGVTRSPDFASTDAAAYPLTTVDYAMVATEGLDSATAGSLAAFLDYAAGAGQVTGELYGGLPGGYAPLSDELAAQTSSAAGLVRAQLGSSGVPADAPPSVPTTGGSGGPTTSGTGGSGSGTTAPITANRVLGGSTLGGAAAGAGATPGPDAVAAVDPAAPATDVAVARPTMPAGSDTPTWFRYLLPIVLVAGLGAALFGTVGSWVAGRGGIAVPPMLRRIPLGRWVRVRRPGDEPPT